MGSRKGTFCSERRGGKRPAFHGLSMEEAPAQSRGGGGNVEMADPNLSGAVAQKKLEEMRRSGANVVVTSCQQCVRTIKGRARRQKTDLVVMDVTEIVLQAMGTPSDKLVRSS
jgi:Fe-S oxidoreductase